MGKRTCSIDECDSPHLARGWCKRHYRSWDKWGDPLAARRALSTWWTSTTEKPCSRCDIVKPLAEFPKQSRGFLGHMAWCSPCYLEYHRRWSDTDVVRAKNTARAYKNKDRIRFNALRRKFGEYAVSIEKRRLAGAGCDVCGQVTDGMSIDHCHTSGLVRGLLCRPCNLTLGYVNDDPAILEALADYLRTNSGSIAKAS